MYYIYIPLPKPPPTYAAPVAVLVVVVCHVSINSTITQLGVIAPTPIRIYMRIVTYVTYTEEK